MQSSTVSPDSPHKTAKKGDLSKERQERPHVGEGGGMEMKSSFPGLFEMKLNM